MNPSRGIGQDSTRGASTAERLKTPGWVFNIQRFSTHDGPGIRTAVFLKGCTLRCLWCHNPESWSPETQIQWFPDLCIRCGACIEVCTTGSRIFQDGMVRYERQTCTACGRCVDICPADAVRNTGECTTVEEVVEKVHRDKPFFETSGGGVTLTGGEPLLQPRFCAGILEECKTHGIQTAVETAAYVPWSSIETVLPSLDLLFLDLKLMDSERHRTFTGVRNDLILANAQRVGKASCKVIVRVPVVPGVNDEVEEIRQLARFAKAMPNVAGMELMRFHALGSGKAASLGISDWSKGRSSPTDEKMASLVTAASTEGLSASIG